MSKLLKRIMEEIVNYSKSQQRNLELMDFLLMVDDIKRIKIKNPFEVLGKIEELINTKKAISSVIVFDKKEENPVVGIRFGDDGIWHLETMNTGERR